MGTGEVDATNARGRRTRSEPDEFEDTRVKERARRLKGGLTKVLYVDPSLEVLSFCPLWNEFRDQIRST